ncbi:hypothetical protein D3C85_1166010 [compost metagenome]
MADGTPANSSRIGVNRPVYVAGFERGVRPIGLWSTLMTLSKCSSPSIWSCAAGSAVLPYRWRATAWYSVSLISVDLPEPETPVMQVSSPTGISAVTLRRLLPVALTMRSSRSSSGVARVLGTSIRRLPDRYWPVSEPGAASICGGVPSATIIPPCTPAPGPMSTT